MGFFDKINYSMIVNAFKQVCDRRHCEPPSNTWSLGPTQVLNPNGISIGSAVFAGLVWQTDLQTDRPTDRQTTLLGL